MCLNDGCINHEYGGQINNNGSQILLLYNNRLVIQADATYKLLWHGFPFLIPGSSDKMRTMHPFGLAVCSFESENDFKFLFDSIQKDMRRLYLPLNSKFSILNGRRCMCDRNSIVALCAGSTV